MLLFQIELKLNYLVDMPSAPWSCSGRLHAQCCILANRVQRCLRWRTFGGHAVSGAWFREILDCSDRVERHGKYRCYLLLRVVELSDHLARTCGGAAIRVLHCGHGTVGTLLDPLYSREQLTRRLASSLSRL